jgi:Ion channel
MSVRGRRLPDVIREELGRLTTWGERHSRLLARILIAIAATVVVDLIAGLLAWDFESGVKGSDVHSFGDALFFTTVQLLTISSSLKNPVTDAGKILDVALEAWAIFVVSAVAGSFAAFFQSGDSA